jgi:hypothetical protein
MSSMTRLMNVEQLLELNFHLFHNNSNTILPGTEPGLPSWEAGEEPAENTVMYFK